MLLQYKHTQTNFSKMSRTEPNRTRTAFFKNRVEPNRTRTRKTRFDSGSSTKLGIASCCRFMLSLREYQKRSVVVKAIPITSLVQLCKFGGIKTPKICVQNKPTFLTYFVFLIFCRLDQKFQPAGSVPLKRLNRSARSVRKTLDRFQI
jgi:hypothetical protein